MLAAPLDSDLYGFGLSWLLDVQKNNEEGVET